MSSSKCQGETVDAAGMPTESACATAVVIGRAGSKGLPGKNIRSLGGRPMIWYTLERIERSRSVKRIILSTDSPTLADQAAHCPLSLPLTYVARPPELARDDSSVQDVVRHAVASTGDDSGICVVLYVNVPLRPVDLIDRAVDMLRRTGADSVQSYVPSGTHHPWWQIRIDEEARSLPWHHSVPDRRQDLPPAFAHDGGIIAVTRASLFNDGPPSGPHAFLGHDRRALVNRAGDVIDIDDALDLHFAEAVLASGTCDYELHARPVGAGELLP